MRAIRHLALLAALLLVIAACGGDSTSLEYQLDPGTNVSYEGEIALGATADIDVPPELLGPETGFSLDESVVVDVAFGLDLGIVVEQGPERGLRRLIVTPTPTSLVGEFSAGGQRTEFDLAFDGLTASGTVTVDGETETLAEQLPPDFPDLAGSIELVIDEEGAIVEVTVGDEAVGAEQLQSISSLGPAFGGAFVAAVLGPHFPSGRVGVGDRWTSDVTIGEGALAVEREGIHELAAVETKDGREVHRIESQITTSGIDIGFTELFELLSSLDTGALEDVEGFEGQIDPELLQQFLEALGVEFSFTVAPSEERSTLWFDAQQGAIVEMTTVSPLDLGLLLSGLPEMSGGIDIAIDGEITQSIRLAE